MTRSELKPNKTSRYAQYLPTVLQQDETLCAFLLAFEGVLTGLESQPLPTHKESKTTDFKDSDVEGGHLSGIGVILDIGIETILDGIHEYFDPKTTPEEFLPWLSGWVGLSLRDEWSTEAKREFLQQIVHLYKLRGTKAGLKAMLMIHLNKAQDKVLIYEFEIPAHYFQMELKLARQEPHININKIARAIIEQEKPAHTFYKLKINWPEESGVKSIEENVDRPPH
jgi:phage tail-like protein